VAALKLQNHLSPRLEQALHTALRGYTPLIVPGLNNSDERHWQSVWQAHLGALRIAVDDWSRPDLGKWSRAITRALAQLEGPVVLIAHSFGCLASAQVAHHLSLQHRNKIAAVLMVAPADPEKFNLVEHLPASVPAASFIVASDNDPWMQADKARALAKKWGAGFTLLRSCGHINSDSGLGHWQPGVRFLAQLTATLPSRELQRRESLLYSARI
jgi:predicted alpha/beta hydrolase family esterase